MVVVELVPLWDGDVVGRLSPFGDSATFWEGQRTVGEMRRFEASEAIWQQQRAATFLNACSRYTSRNVIITPNGRPQTRFLGSFRLGCRQVFRG